MKHFLTLLVAITALLATACGENEITNDVTLDTTPTLRTTCATTIALPSAAATDGVVVYEVLYPLGDVIATASSDVAWLVPEVSTAGTMGSYLAQPMMTAKVRYHIAANNGAARKATLTLNYAGISSVEISFTQPEGKPEEVPSYPEDPETPENPDTPVNPTPVNGIDLAKYTGWGELPSVVKKEGDYYYTRHYIDVNNPQGTTARNYAACYSRTKQCVVWVAAPMHSFYTQKNTSRTDAYGPDPSFDFTQMTWTFSQIGYQRGHMLGSADRYVSRLANEQTCYFSNIAPQLASFNQGTWGQAETLEGKQWQNQADTTYQVIGAYWDPAKSPIVKNGVEVPTHYYKVLLRTKNHVNKAITSCSKAELQCVAIMIEHKDYSATVKYSEFVEKGWVMSVADLEKLTGFNYFTNVPNAPKESYSAAEWGL
ncbi:MAG: DNA/RNA non-specific endonuclease [Alistipes sp.]|nr:DNA/RNA non-specific endonuclease [Alistipes sp.]